MLAVETEDFSVPENIRSKAVKINQKADNLITTINDYFTIH